MDKETEIESNTDRLSTTVSGGLHKFVMWFFSQWLHCLPEQEIETISRQETIYFVVFRRFRGRVYISRIIAPPPSHPNCRCVCIPVD